VFSVWIVLFLISLSPLFLIGENLQNVKNIYTNVLLFTFTSVGIILGLIVVFYNEEWGKKHFSIMVMSSFFMLLLYQTFDFIYGQSGSMQFFDWWVVFWIGAYFPFISMTIRRIIKDVKHITKSSIFTGLALTSLSTVVIIPIFSYFFENSIIGGLELFAMIFIVVVDLISFIMLNILLVLYFRLKYSHYWFFMVVGFTILVFRDVAGAYSYMLDFLYPSITVSVLNLFFLSTLLVGLITLFDKEFSFKSMKDIEAESEYYKARYDELDYLSKDLITVTELWFHDLKNDINVLENSIILHEENPKTEYMDIIKKRLALMGERQDKFQSPASILDSLKVQPIDVSIINGIQKAFSSVEIDIPEEPLYVKANKLLFPIVLNVVQNAFQHGGNGIHVSITVKEEQNVVVIQIKDDGQGIPDADKKKIFTNGYRSSESDSTGLGLYLVKLAADKFGAKIDVEDNHPKGAIFSLRFQKINK